tara:strand:+ start:580 stop:1086 length:507 start_codon:yes stop_codon:yes gene_type:complete
MNKIIIFSLVIFLSNKAFSKVSIYKDYEVTIDELKLIKAKIKKSSTRPFPMKNYPIFFTISDSKNIFLFCPANMPTPDQRGCHLNFKYDDQVGQGISIIKDIVLENVIENIETRTSELDPNNTEEHLHFGNIFGPEDKSTSHLYCEPRGLEGTKVWTCTLSVQEYLSK